MDHNDLRRAALDSDACVSVRHIRSIQERTGWDDSDMLGEILDALRKDEDAASLVLDYLKQREEEES